MSIFSVSTSYNLSAVSSKARLRDQEQYLNILNLISTLIAYVDKNLCYQFANTAYGHWIGMEVDSIIGKTVAEVLGEDIFLFLKPRIEIVLSGQSIRFENTLYNKNGLRYLDVCFTPDTNENNEVIGYLATINDITQQKQQERELKDYVETATIGLHWVNADGIIIWANQAELDMLGYTKEEYIGHPVADFHVDSYTIGDILKRLSKNETLNQYEAALRCKDGSTRQVTINSSVLWENGKFIHTRCFTIDITEQKKAMQALNESEAQYRNLLQLLPAAVYTCDIEGYVQLFNQAAVTLWGRTPVVGKDKWCGSWKIFHPVSGEPVALDTCPMAITLKEGKAVVGQEIVIERPDGVRRNVIPNPQPIVDISGHITGAINMLVDITDEKIALQSIREKDERFRMIAQLAPVIIWMSDAEGNAIFFNEEWTRLTGLAPEEGYAEQWLLLVHPKDKANVYHTFMSSTSDEIIYSDKFQYQNADGTYSTIQANAIPRFNENGKFTGYIGVWQNLDLQEQLTASLEQQIQERTIELLIKNEALRKSEERNHRMVSEVQDYAILLLSKEGNVENWNKGAERIKGYTEEDIMGKNFRLFYTNEDQESNLPERLLQTAVQNGRALSEGWRVRKDGSQFWGSIVLTALHDDQNRVVGFSKVTRDLTERKAAEESLKEKNKELILMNQELSSFAYVASHDLQEPLRKIQTFITRLLELEGGNFSELGKDFFNRIQNSATRMRKLIEDLLSYSRMTTTERKFELTDLNKLLQDIKTEYSEFIEEKKAILEFSSLPQINAISFQIYQLIANLLTNALKFSKTDIIPYITIKADIVKGKEISGSMPEEEQKEYHHISFSDNGIGFEPEYNTQIFDIFQRLHGRSEYEGTGVGLAICKKIVDNHGGFITADGKINEGATFHIYLPL